MLTAVSPGGFEFVWRERNDYVEVYHKDACYSDQPVEVIWAGDLSYNQGTLNKLANESRDYARGYATQ